ncbi:MAG: ethanolamine utilization protein EutN [Thermoanaerobaculia bacterium]|nr:ethanolamine utilization protein EutN [Thermoanaerobaculia bacterium]
MRLGEVVGTVVASTKVPGLEGIRLLIVQPIDATGKAAGGAVVAADAIHQAGVGERVYFVASREAAVALPNSFVPVDHAILGIVDQIHLDPTAKDAP